MRLRSLIVIIAGMISAGAVLAQQPLVCPGSAGATARPCDAFHYHVQMYRPDTRGFAEVTGVNQFASQAACETARESQLQRNQAVVDHFRRVVGEQKYEPDRFGACHCDMTFDRSSPTFLADAQRDAQFRLQEEIRLRVRERLLNEKVPSDSPLVRGLFAGLTPSSLLGTPKLVPLPRPAAAAPLLPSTNDLRSTKAIDTSAPAVASLDLPLVDVEGLAIAAVPAPPAATIAAESAAEPPPATQEVRVDAETEAAPPVHEPSPEELASAQQAAESFVSVETQRVQNVVKASAAIADETVKAKIFEACMERLQLLSNLRLLIEGAGMRSRIAHAARSATSESERLDVVARLFGDDIRKHWAPRDAADVILDVSPDIAREPERALRDTSGRFSIDQRKRALYVFLAVSQPGEDQRLWLTNVIDAFLQ